MSDLERITSQAIQTDHLSPYEQSVPGTIGMTLPELDVPESPLPPSELLRTDLAALPSFSKPQAVRYYARQGKYNFSLEDGLYPLGSCTMKHNPRVNEVIAGLPGFTMTHPEQVPEQVQGNLRLMHELQTDLTEITGMDAVGLTPMAGAQSEYAGILTIKKYHEKRGELEQRTTVLVPDSAHGTNPATASMAGFKVKKIESDADGNVDLAALAEALGDDVAAMMFTQPSTLGLFDPNIEKIADMLHASGAQLYGDGANMNALVGRVRPGDLGFDVMHLNLHKTFSTPHGGGGPGSAPVCVKEHLAPFLPDPVIQYDNDRQLYVPVNSPDSIGRMGEAYGNFGMYVRAHAYIRSLGSQGLRAISDSAVLNANYLRASLEDVFEQGLIAPAFDRVCMHEFVVSLAGLRKATDVSALDVAKGLIDAGHHPPTMYFPTTVLEALMIEPTESESKTTLDGFAATIREILEIATDDPDYLKQAPHTTPVGRPDEVAAAKHPVLRWPL